MNLNLESAVKEWETFPWGVVNNLAEVSPHTLQSVNVALRLWVLEVPPNGIMRRPSCLASNEPYFREVRSALPSLVKILIVSQKVCSSSQFIAGLILMVTSSRNFLVR